MRHLKLATLAAFVGLLMILPAVRANATPPPLSSWFPVAESVWGLMVHSDGSVWVGGPNHIYRYARTGTQLGVVAAYGATSMAEAPGGDVYALDYWARTVNHYTSGGALLGSWPMALAAREGGRVAVDASGNVYVLCFTSGFTTSAIVKYDGVGNQLASVTGLVGSDGLAISGGQLYCSEIYGGDIRIFTPALAPVGTIPNPATYGTGLAADKAGNLLQPDYYGDFSGKSVHHLTTSGSVLGRFVITGTGYYPTWIPAGAGESDDHTYFVGDVGGFVLLFHDATVPVTTQSWGDLKATFR